MELKRIKSTDIWKRLNNKINKAEYIYAYVIVIFE